MEVNEDKWAIVAAPIDCFSPVEHPPEVPDSVTLRPEHMLLRTEHSCASS